MIGCNRKKPCCYGKKLYYENMSRTYEEIKELFSDDVDESVGSFYKLSVLERKYHEPAIIRLLSNVDYNKQVVKNLVSSLPDSDELRSLVESKDFSIEELTREKFVETSGKYIDIYFELRFGKDSVYPVVLELKTNTNNHTNQLSEYYTYITNSSNNARFFYVSLDGKNPDSESSGLEKKYVCLKYYDLIADICEAKDRIIQDYIDTLKMLEKHQTNDNERLLICYTFFRLIKENLGNSMAKIQLYYKERNRRKENPVVELKDETKLLNIDFNKVKRLCLTLVVEKDEKRLGIERRWEYNNKQLQRSMYYGVMFGKNESKKKDDYNTAYYKLAYHWSKVGEKREGLRSLNAIVNETDFVIKEGEKKDPSLKNRVNTDIWCVVQFLTDWVMEKLDSLLIIDDTSSPKSWAKWIESDFEYIK